MQEVVAAIEEAEPSATGRITYEDTPLPFPDGQDDEPLRARLGELPYTPLAEGVARTIVHFQAAIADGRLPQSEG
jgi:hypothetical protein